MGKIKQLNAAVARQIAAGEVIERPASVVRELLDNAIDSGATFIELSIRSGGIKEIEVLDNGIGMDKEDLEISILPHATSKITTAQDIYNLSTLGFRGEALSSIAACSKLTICSKLANSENGHKIVAEDGILKSSQIYNCKSGTKVCVKDIFYSLPGRKKFLKSAQGEALSIANIFFEKVAPFPEVSFKYFSDDKLLHFLPQTTLLERIKLLYKKRFSTDLLYYASKEFDLATKIQIVGGSPSLYRRDKKLIHIYLNKRKINEYALLQACEYGYSELLPGGAMPVCFAFIEVDPKTVDFNIHPAKKEAKIENINLIRSHLISLIKEFLSQFRENNNYIKLSEKIPSIADFSSSSLDFEMATNQGSNLQTNSDELDFLSSPKFKKIEPNEFFSKPENNFYKEQTNMVLHNLVSKLGNFKENNYTKTNYTSDSLRTQPEVVSEHPVSVADDKRVDAKLIGIFKNFFIIAEYQDKLFFIDQHAAHEKLIFNQLVKNKSSQPLLIPLPINSTNPNLDYTQEQLKALEAIGIKLEKLLATGSNNESEKIWHITALPGIMHSDVLTITKFLEELTCDTFEIEKSLFATIACKKAIKEGQPIDKEFATYIANSTLALDKPNCPHGRPLYFTLSHKELCFLVGRTL